MYKLMCVLETSTLKKTIDFAVDDVPLGTGSVISDHLEKPVPSVRSREKANVHVTLVFAWEGSCKWE